MLDPHLVYSQGVKRVDPLLGVGVQIETSLTWIFQERNLHSLDFSHYSIFWLYFQKIYFIWCDLVPRKTVMGRYLFDSVCLHINGHFLYFLRDVIDWSDFLTGYLWLWFFTKLFFWMSVEIVQYRPAKDEGGVCGCKPV